MPIAKHTSPAQNARQHVHLHVLGHNFIRIGPLCRSATKCRPHRCVGDAEFLGDDVALEKMRSRPPYFSARSCRSNPWRDAAGKFLAVRIAVAGTRRVEGAGARFPRQERATPAQFVAFGWQAIWSKLSAVLMALIQLAGRDKRPEFFRPREAMRLPSARPISSLGGSRRHASMRSRIAMQDVLVGEAIRAVHLMAIAAPSCAASAERIFAAVASRKAASSNAPPRGHASGRE